MLDLADTTYIDSCGLALIVRAHGRLGQPRGAVVIRSPGPAARKLLGVTGVDRLVTIEGPRDGPGVDRVPTGLDRRLRPDPTIRSPTPRGEPWPGSGATARARPWSSSEVVVDLVGGVPVVKAVNTLGAAVLGADPHEAGGQRVLFLSGDDLDAKAEVSALFQDAGFFTIDLGDLITGGEMQQIGAPLAGANLIRLPDPN